VSAVWGIALAAVRRRRLQSAILAVVVLCSTVAIVVALGLLEASSGPFDRTFAAQRGPHVVATFDRAAVSDALLAETARRPGVEAAAGPYGQSVVTVADTRQSLPPGPLTVVGRPGPGGPVDRVELWAGRWAERPGEIVVNRPVDPVFGDLVGAAVQTVEGLRFTVVGLASSVTRTAEAWVAPAQMEAMKPASAQMLYRFVAAETAAEVRAATAAVTAGLPPSGVLGTQSYLTVKRDVSRAAEAYLPFLAGFGLLGLLVAVLIVANVISGAVVAGQRQMMVLLPAFAGCLAGTVLGALVSQKLLDLVFAGIGAAIGLGIGWPVYVAALLGVPAVVVLAALVPASRAHRLPAAETIRAGSAPRPGRGQAVQRLLSGSRLPRPVSLGLGLPFARPGRSAMTLAAIVLGVAAVTLATGLFQTMTAYGDTAQRVGRVHSIVHVGRPGQVRPTLDDAAIEALLRSRPGVRHVTANAWIDVRLPGLTSRSMAQFLRGDAASRGDVVVAGRYVAGPGEVAAPSAFMRRFGLRVGDRLTLALGGARTQATIVGEVMDAADDLIIASWSTLTALDPAGRATQYEVGLAPGTDVERFNAAVKAAEPGLYPRAKSQADQHSVAVIGAAALYTVLLGTVATLGVFNTVVLTTRERRRDLAMLKSIGMTPRQVTLMTVTSMALLGVVGGLAGLPIGVASHRVVVLAMLDAAGLGAPAMLLDVWRVAALAALLVAGVAIAVLGAFLPARRAARLTIAGALRTE
jgi:putative ABC transport system permease protein